MHTETADATNSRTHFRSAPKRRVHLRNSIIGGSLLTALVGTACGLEVSSDDGEVIDRASSALSADDCRKGSGCTSPTWTYDVTPQSPSDWGASDYCVDRKCKKGEGDCDGSAQCESGLSCVAKRGAFVGLPATVDICWPTDHVCKQLGPCASSEGDCDSFPGEQGPRQCAEGTYCREEGNVDRCRTRTPDDLDAYLAAATISAPGAAAAVFDSDGMIAIGVRGVRKFGSTAKIAKTDVFHLGSNTKAMTATLAAVLDSKSETGVDWDETDSWHDKRASYAGGMWLFNILGHRGGFPADVSISGTGSARSQREEVADLAWVTPSPSGIVPGLYFYSNTGYQVAADIMEHMTGDTYENLIDEYLWGPLGMDSCRWTDPSTNPVWGHKLTWVNQGGVQILTYVPELDYYAAYHNSSGRAHCSLEDWGKFLREHVRGLSDKSALLPKAYYRKDAPADHNGMHDSPGALLSHYQAGWVVGDYLGDYSLWHNGSNGLNYSIAMVIPARNIAVVVVANAVAGVLGNLPAQLEAVRADLIARYRP
jgi:CubicO group peptidase (beta-lactamase class C family)